MADDYQNLRALGRFGEPLCPVCGAYLVRIFSETFCEDPDCWNHWPTEFHEEDTDDDATKGLPGNRL